MVAMPRLGFNKPRSGTYGRNDGPPNVSATLLRASAPSLSLAPSQEKIKTFFKLSAYETVISKQRKVLGTFSLDTCGVAASHNGDSALSFQKCCRADNEGK